MEIIKTSVIGSYPIETDNMKFIKNYFNGLENFWDEYISAAVNDMIKAGIDLISDGQTRDPFINIFTRNIKGCRIRDRPEVINKLEYLYPIIFEDIIKINKYLPKNKGLIGVIAGPYTLSESVVNFYYKNKMELAFDFAEIIKKEIDLIKPYVDITKKLKCLTRLHVCGDVSKIIPDLINLPVDVLSHEFKAKPQLINSYEEYENNKKICLGSVRSDNIEIESVEEIISHVDQASSIFGEKIIQISPDCGQRLLPRDIAFKKLINLVKAGEVINGR